MSNALPLAETTARRRRVSRSLPLLAAAVALASAGVAHAQDLAVKAPAQSQTIVIRNAVVHPVSGPAIESGYVIFENGTITGVGPADPHMPSTWKVIDAHGQHVYPGLIGAYTQIGLSEIQAVRATEDQREVGQITPEAAAIVSINPDSTLMPVTRVPGVLSVGVFPTGGVISGQPCVISLEGWTWEEMAVRRSLGVCVNWPFPRPITAWWQKTPKEEQEKQIKKRIDAIDDAFSKSQAYARARAAGDAVVPDIRWDAMSPLFDIPATADTPTPRKLLPYESKQSFRPRMFVVANDVEQIEQVVGWAEHVGVKTVIVGGRDAPLCAETLKRHDVPVIVLGLGNFPKRNDADYDEAFSLPARLEAAGVRWCLASGEETPHERSLPYHAGRAVAYGLSPDAALRSVTLSAAQILGVDDVLGSLAHGKAATLIVTDGDPLEVTTHVTQAFINGREIDLTSKQSKLADKYREKYKQLQKTPK